MIVFDKFNWNGIFFELNQRFFFNLIYDAKVTNFQDLNEYTKLINVNLPILKNSPARHRVRGCETIWKLFAL